MRLVTLTAIGLLALAASLGAQQPLDRARAALAKADYALARAALLDILAEESPDRAKNVGESLSVFTEKGAADEWIKASARWTGSHPDDAMIRFYRGTLLQDLKHLRRADEDLSRARALAPNDPGVQLYWSWNATDPAEALERAKGASFPGVEEFRKEREAKLAAFPWGAVVLLGLVGAALTAVAAIALSRAG